MQATSVISQLIPLEKSNNEKQSIVLLNITKMLINRKLIHKEKFWDDKNKKLDNDKIMKLVEVLQTTNSDIYRYPLDKYDSDDSKDYVVKLVNQKISAINKTSGIVDHLNKFKKNLNMIVVLDINNKSSLYINKNFPNTEIFLETDLLFNLVESIIIPQHEVLSKEEGEKVLSAYQAVKKNMPKINSGEKVARYYNMQPGQICKILRPSETSGYVPFYRLVVKSAM